MQRRQLPAEALVDLRRRLADLAPRSAERRVLMLYSVVDDRSGMAYQEYHGVYGEDVEAALRFLFNAMAPKSVEDFPFQGRPRMLYMDGGPIAKSLVFHKVMGYLGIEVAPTCRGTAMGADRRPAQRVRWNDRSAASRRCTRPSQLAFWLCGYDVPRCDARLKLPRDRELARDRKSSLRRKRLTNPGRSG
jgi:hypothetical protein